MIKLFCKFGFILITSSLALGKGGGIVGNGGGISEQNIIYAYDSLPQSIDQCLSPGNICQLLADEIAQLRNIRQVFMNNLGKPNLIQFVSEREVPDFFELSVAEQHRIAKTGLTAQDPIFINSDLLYNSDGSSAMDFALATAILIHEVGHQSGNPNHAFLDGIGAKLRQFLNQKVSNYSFDAKGNGLSVQIYNYDNPTLRSEVFFNYAGSRELLTPAIVNQLSCSFANSTLLGFEIWNGHWDDSTTSTTGSLIPFEAWLHYTCVNNGLLENNKANLKLIFQALSPGKMKLVEVSAARVN